MTTSSEVLLEGPEGGDLPGFLCALGALRLLEASGVRGGWRRTGGGWRIAVVGLAGEEAILDALEVALAREREDWLALLDGPPAPLSDIRMPVDEYEARALAALDRPSVAALAAAVTSELASRDGRTVGSQLAFTPVAQTNWVGNVRNVLSQARREPIRAALFAPWTYPDPAAACTFNWDAREFRQHALMAADPSSSPAHERATTQLGGAVLGLAALPGLLTTAHRGGPHTAGFRPRTRTQPLRFVWPLWSGPVPARVVYSALLERWEHASASARQGAGVEAVFSSAQASRGKYRNFLLAHEV